jgi:hypothetical protein
VRRIAPISAQNCGFFKILQATCRPRAIPCQKSVSHEAGSRHRLREFHSARHTDTQERSTCWRKSKGGSRCWTRRRASARIPKPFLQNAASPRTARDGPWRPGRENHRPPSKGQDGPKSRAGSTIAGGASLRQVPECDATLDLDERGGYSKCSATMGSVRPLSRLPLAALPISPNVKKQPAAWILIAWPGKDCSTEQLCFEFWCGAGWANSAVDPDEFRVARRQRSDRK